MKPHRKYILAILGVATLFVAMNCFALTLGRAKGAVHLGQALTLTVPVQMEMGEGASALCFDADVFYGDIRQDSSQVKVSSAVSPNSPAATVTIAARATVDEPVVTVYLRAGCESKTTRRYVMLTELATGAAQAPNVVNSSLIFPIVQPTPLNQSSTPSAGATTTAPHVTERARAVVLKTEPEALLLAKPAITPQKLEIHRAHLKLVPLNLMPESDPTLKLSNVLVTEVGDDPQKHARAAILWRSLNTSPQDIAGAEGRRQALESDLKGLHDLTLKNRQVLDELTRRLTRAESERYSNPLVYALIAATVVFCLTIAYLWNRTRRGLVGAPWWRADVNEDMAETAELGGDALPVPDLGRKSTDKKVDLPSEAPSYGASRPSSYNETGTEDIDLAPKVPADFRQKPLENRVKKNIQPVALRKSVPAAPAGSIDFANSMSATLRAVNTKEMLDVRQQAEFFMTLGQQDEAIALLIESVDGSAGANPLVYLELLKVLHTLGRKVEYGQYQTAFNAIFCCHVPAYADFSQSSSGLEAYPQVCNRIVALWPSEEVVFYIESCLVRSDEDSDARDFDLEAFRDLLMLHGVASRIATASFDSGFMAFSTLKTVPAPTSDASEVDIDLDLSEPFDNLIDFDASSWSPPTPAGDNPKAR